MKRALISSLLLVFSVIYASAFYSPWDSHHDLRELCHLPSDSVWTITNTSDTIRLDVTDCEIRHCDDFTLTTRLSSLNNLRNRRYHYRDNNGKRHSIAHPAWGVVAIDSAGNRVAATFKTIATSDWEYTAQDAILATLSLNDSILQSDTINYPEIEPFTLSNTVVMERHGYTFSVSIGSRYLKKTISHKIADFDVAHMGYITHPAAQLQIERSQLLISTYPQATLMTEWNSESIVAHFNQSVDPLEGYWALLDRSLDDDLLRLGGNYTFALIRNGKGYDLIYISGADINSGSWREGMLKARLTPTKFGGNYHITWWDSNMMPLSKDLIASVENNLLMTIQFPYQSSHIRLHRISHP